jgi:hypothetical protein
MRSLVQRFAAALLALVALASPAYGSGQHEGRAWFATVRLITLPHGGTLIHVHGSGYGRTVLRSSEDIAAAAVRDVDADGDLDVIASSGHGLVLWRNLGAGRFVLAAPPTRKVRHRAGPGLAVPRTPAQVLGAGEQPRQLAAPPSTLTTRVAPAAAPIPLPDSCPRTPATRTHTGRAPPVHA